MLIGDSEQVQQGEHQFRGGRVAYRVVDHHHEG